MDPGTEYTIRLDFRTSCGTLPSNTLRLHTLPSTDLTGLYLQIFADSDGTITSLAAELGAHVLPPHALDEAGAGELPTHLVAAKAGNVPVEAFMKAASFGIPAVTPDWLQACLAAKRILPTGDYGFRH